MKKKTYYEEVILRNYQYEKLLELADAKHRQIEERAEALAQKKLEELKPKIEVTIYNDRSDDKHTLYITASNQISKELEPAALCVKYWVEELCLGQWARVSGLEDNINRLASTNIKLLLAGIGLFIGLVLAIAIR
jgi:Fe-S oxidoreductase